MKENQQIQLINWIKEKTIRVDVESLGLKGVYGIIDPAKFVDDLFWELERKNIIPKKII